MSPTTFSTTVNKVMLGNKSPIRKLRIRCLANTLGLKSWISGAITRKVEEIELDVVFVRSHVFKMPRISFTSETLAVLKLSGCAYIKAPTKSNLPNLKTMVLSSVTYHDEESAGKLISCCPNLENLSIFRQVRSDNVEKFRIHAPKLKSLRINFSISAPSGRESLDIDAPSLEYLDIKDYISRSASFANVGCLNEAKICFEIPSACQSLINCLEAFNNLKSLSLSYPWSFPQKVMKMEPGLSEACLFNLNHLTMEVGSPWRSLLPYFFLCSPNLHVLRLVKDPSSENPVAPYYRLCIKPELLPRNLLSQLRAVEIEDFWDTENDLGMLKYIVENGKVLETVRVHVHYTEPAPLSRDDFVTTRPGKPREFEEKVLVSKKKCSELELKLRIAQPISGFRRGSATCKITYI